MLLLFDVVVRCLLLFGCRSVFVMRIMYLPLFVVACFDRSCSSLTCVVRCCLWSLVAFACCVLFVGVFLLRVVCSLFFWCLSVGVRCLMLLCCWLLFVVRHCLSLVVVCIALLCVVCCRVLLFVVVWCCRLLVVVCGCLLVLLFDVDLCFYSLPFVV